MLRGPAHAHHDRRTLVGRVGLVVASVSCASCAPILLPPPPPPEQVAPQVQLPVIPLPPGRQSVIFDMQGGKATVVDEASGQRLCDLTPCVADLPVGMRAIRFSPVASEPGVVWNEGAFRIQVQDSPIVVRHELSRTITNRSPARKVGLVVLGVGAVGTVVFGYADPDSFDGSSKGAAIGLLAALGVTLVADIVGALLIWGSRDHVVPAVTTQWRLPQPPVAPSVAAPPEPVLGL